MPSNGPCSARYMSLETLGSVSDTATVSLPAVAA